MVQRDDRRGKSQVPKRGDDGEEWDRRANMVGQRNACFCGVIHLRQMAGVADSKSPLMTGLGKMSTRV